MVVRAAHSSSSGIPIMRPGDSRQQQHGPLKELCSWLGLRPFRVMAIGCEAKRVRHLVSDRPKDNADRHPTVC